VNMSARWNLDFKLVGIVAILIGIGLPMVLSASHLLSYRDYGQPTYYLQRQGLWVVIGFVVMFVFSQIPYTFWRRVSILLMAATVATLAAVLAFAAVNNGARRWLSEGSFQPSEVAKLVTIIYVGHWLASRQDKLGRVSYGLIPFYVIVGGVAGVVILLTFGTGIGSALLIDGTLVPNTELGHLELGGHDAEKRAAASVRDEHKMSYKKWAERVQDYMSYVELLFTPDLFVVGGGVSKDAAKWVPLLELNTPVKPAELLNDAGIVGAAMAAAERHGE